MENDKLIDLHFKYAESKIPDPDLALQVKIDTLSFEIFGSRSMGIDAKWRPPKPRRRHTRF